MDAPVVDHAHHLVTLLTNLLLFFGVAGLVVPLLQRVKLSPVLGYLVCGIIIGPAGLGAFVTDAPWLSPLVIEDTDTVQILGELGIIALLFMIGLELSFRRLSELKKFVLGLGSAQILVTAAVISVVAYNFNNTLPAALVLGASLALSSTAIVVQLLREQHLFNRPVGVLCFSILLMQDLAVVPILIMASVLVQSDANIGLVIGQSLLLAFASVSVIYLMGKKLLRPLMRTVSFTKNPEWLTAFMLFVVISCATLTQSAGLSAALGAFLAGLLIAETEFRHEIEIIIDPLKNLLMGLFFLSIGMMIDLSAILSNPLWILVSVVGIFVVKAAILYPLARMFGVETPQAIKASLMLAQPGEFAFLILSVALVSGLVPQENGQFFLLVTAVAMLLSPLLFNLAPHLARRITGHVTAHAPEEDNGKTRYPEVIIAGFGRIGHQIGEVLERQQILYRAIDSEISCVYKWQAQGLPVIYGDARRMEQWRLMQADKARVIIITIDNHIAAAEILRTIRKNWPNISVLMRSEDTTDMEKLYDLGAEYVIPEALESSLQLASNALKALGIEQNEIDETIEVNRKNALLTHSA